MLRPGAVPSPVQKSTAGRCAAPDRRALRAAAATAPAAAGGGADADPSAGTTGGKGIVIIRYST